MIWIFFSCLLLYLFRMLPGIWVPIELLFTQDFLPDGHSSKLKGVKNIEILDFWYEHSHQKLGWGLCDSAGAAGPGPPLWVAKLFTQSAQCKLLYFLPFFWFFGKSHRQKSRYLLADVRGQLLSHKSRLFPWAGNSLSFSFSVSPSLTDEDNWGLICPLRDNFLDSWVSILLSECTSESVGSHVESRI